MSTLGYAIIFYLCGASGQDCQEVAVRASRFAELRQCQATIPEALRQAGRNRSSIGHMIAQCRSLDEVCAPTLTSWQSSGAKAERTRLLHLANDGPLRSRSDGPLAILCTKPAPADCGT